MILFIAACNKIPDDIPIEVAAALKQAGSNKEELLKVYRHYEKAGDSLKFEAAIFLIKNINRQKSIFHKDLKKYDNYFQIVGSRSGIQKEKVLDSLKEIFKEIKGTEVETERDIAFIKAEYLINNIDSAFMVWGTRPWRNKYSFSQFCEYVLPYKIADLFPEPWRDTLVKTNNPIADTMQAKDSISKLYGFIYTKTIDRFLSKTESFYPDNMGFHNLHTGKFGKCTDQCNYTVLNMRAMGIPAAIEFIPLWGNVRLGHEWVSLIMPDSTPFFSFTNFGPPGRYWNYVHASRSFDKDVLYYLKSELTGHSISPILHSNIFKTQLVETNGIPDYIQIQTQKTMAKIFRIMYSPQNYCSSISKEGPDYVPPLFINDRLMDVTNSYIDCSDVQMKIQKPEKEFKYVFLCLFDRERFVPIQWSKLDYEGNLVFENMGLDVVYFPMYYENQKFSPASHPFILRKDGKLDIVPSVKERTTMKLFRKYPLSLRMVYFASSMLEGRFEGANDSLFSQPQVLHTVRKTPYYWTEATISDQKKYQYLRYINPKPDIGVAEIKFIAMKGGTETKLQGKVMCSKGEYYYPAKDAFDNDMETFAHSKEANIWIGIDLGAGNSTTITKIRYCPRNDTNEIIPGNEYELCLWDNEWKSMGIQTAQNNYLIFDNIPAKGLYWLKNLSGGIEERIFTYENGIQVWW